MAQKHFRLLDLPPELVGHVYSYLEDDFYSKRPACRALLPYTRRNRFRVVNLSKSTPILSFLDFFGCGLSCLEWKEPTEPSPLVQDLALLVKELYVGAIRGVFDADETARRIARAVSFMRNITKAEVGDQAVLSEVLRLGKRGGFGRLEELKVDIESVVTADLFDSDHLGTLSSFPALERLTLDLEFLMVQPMSSSTHDYPSVPHLTTLHIKQWGPFANSEPVHIFVSRLLNLQSFSLELTTDSNPSRLLECLPSTLRSLCVAYYPELDSAELATNVDAVIPRFTTLHSLTLGVALFSQSSAFYDLLQTHLPSLRTFEITNYELFEVNTANLIPFVRARGGPAGQLKRVVIDTVCGGPYGGMGYQEALELEEVTQEAGVELGGSIRAALQVENEREWAEYYLYQRSSGMSHEDAVALCDGPTSEDEDEEEEE
ncbi:hypothetical protein JCM6882_002731 [Rhodosporidiobolus microsporus]